MIIKPSQMSLLPTLTQLILTYPTTLRQISYDNWRQRTVKEPAQSSSEQEENHTRMAAPSGNDKTGKGQPRQGKEPTHTWTGRHVQTQTCTYIDVTSIVNIYFFTGIILEYL